jgi:hypothetical protein
LLEKTTLSHGTSYVARDAQPTTKVRGQKHGGMHEVRRETSLRNVRRVAVPSLPPAKVRATAPRLVANLPIARAY